MRIGSDGDFSRRVGLQIWRAQMDQMQTSMARLSSGLRINSAVDDAAGLAIAEGMRAQMLGARQAQQNVQDGVNLLRVVDAALSESMGLLQRMRVIAVQAGNWTYGASQRAVMQEMLQHALESLDGIARNTQYNTMRLLDGSRSAWSFQVGAGRDHSYTVSLAGAAGEHLGLGAGGTFAATPAPAEPAPSAAPPTAPTDPASNPTAPSDSTAPSPVETVTYSVASFSGSKAKNVVSFTGDPVAGTYWVQGGTVYAGDASGSVVGSYTNNGFLVTFAAGGSVTMDARLWRTPGNDQSGGFTLTRTVTQSQPAPPASAAPAAPASSPTETTQASATGSLATISVRTVEEAGEALTRIDEAIALLNERRAGVGVAENALLRQMQFLDVSQLNLAAAQGRIRDVDVAAEASRLIRLQAAGEAGAMALTHATQAQFEVVALLLGSLPTVASAAAGASAASPPGPASASASGAPGGNGGGGTRRAEPAVPAVNAVASAPPKNA